MKSKDVRRVEVEKLTEIREWTQCVQQESEWRIGQVGQCRWWVESMRVGSLMTVEKPAAAGGWPGCMSRTMELDILPSSMAEPGPSKPAEQGWWQRKMGYSTMGRCMGWQHSNTGHCHQCKV